MFFSMETLFLIGTFAALVYLWCKYNYSYWNRHGIQQVKPMPFIGNIFPFLSLKTSFGLQLSDIYSSKQYQNAPVVGIYILNKPALVVRDLDLVKRILIKDFNYFPNRFGAADPHNDSLGSNNLFFVKNPEWKEIRTKITPVFTSGKVKQLYPLMLQITDELEQYLDRSMKAEKKISSEIKEICALFTTDMIATIAFGIRVNSLRNPQAQFRRIARKMFDFDLRRAKDFFVAFFLPNLVSTLKIEVFSKEFSNYMRATINHVMEEREKCGNMRNDLIDILVSLKKTTLTELQKDKLDPAENDFLVAQAAVFLTAGFETSSSTMAFALYELAKKPEIQNRLREEICDAMVEGKGYITYERIHSMEYLGMVVDETLRLYPVLPFLDREFISNKQGPRFAMKDHPDYRIPEQLAFYIPIYAMQRDEKYWTNPNLFDPNRFSAENKKNIEPMSYLPFGTGPHNCIGSRIGLLQTKLGLAHFLKNHYVTPCDSTLNDIVFDPKAFILQNTGGIHLNIVKDSMFDMKVQKA